MEIRKILSLIVPLLFLSSATYTQVPDSVYYNRLFNVCKAWGHVKYYHTEVANGNVNWDDELLHAINGIKTAPDNDSFNESLFLMLKKAGTMGISSVALPDIPDSLNNNGDISWIQNPIFSDSVNALLDTIRSRFKPQSNVYVSKAWEGVGANPIFITDTLYSSDSAYPSEEKRILALFRYWNIIHYFFPYKNIMDQNWDTTLVEFIPSILEAHDALSYHLAFKRLTTKINDSHSFFSSSTFWDWDGDSYPPFQIRLIENEFVITKVLPHVKEVRVGDVIKEIDGVNVTLLRDSLRKFALGSNATIVERSIIDLISWGKNGSFTITVDNGVNTQTAVLDRSYTNWNQLEINTDPVWKHKIINDNCHFGIIDMGRLETTDVQGMIMSLWATDALIFDIRNYPRGALFQIVNYLYPSSIHIANFTVPDSNYPGKLSWNPAIIGSGTSNPYSGKVILLFDERTQSHAEYTCMGLEQFSNAIKIGSTTAGADGNVSKIHLPGKIEVYATFLGTFYPDFTPTQRVGIIPDFEIHPSILGIRSGEDELMNFALNCNNVSVNEIEIAENFNIYPNPASHQLTIDTKLAIKKVSIINLTGKVVAMYNHPIKQINVEDLSAGVYFMKITTNKEIITKKFVKR